MEKKEFKIVVCLKVIHQLYSERGFDGIKRTIDPEYLVKMVNPADEYALEMALLLKERIEERRGHAEIFVLSIAPNSDEEILRRALAMGADSAFRIWEEGFETLNAMALAYLLSVTISRVGGDLIFCGKKSSDMNGNEVGGYLAEFLHLPQVSEVTSLNMSQEGDRMICRRKMERWGWDLVETSTPVVLTVERGENEPRYPNLFSILNWLEKEVKILDTASLGIDKNRLKEWDSLVRVIEWNRPKPKKVFTPKSDLPPEERIRLALTGGIEQKKAKFLLGEAREIVSQVVDLLLRQKILKTGGEK